MTTIATSPDMVALVQASTTLPVMLFSLAAGAISDNYDRRLIMLIAQSFMFVISTALAVLAWFGLIGPWLLLTFTFLIGCGIRPEQSGVAIIRRRHRAATGHSRRDHAQQRQLQLRAQRRAGARRADRRSAGVATAFVINAVSYVALIAVLLRWRPVRPERLLPRETMGIAMSAGLRYVAMSPNILSVILRGFAFGFGGIVTLALLPLIARDLVKGGAADLRNSPRRLWGRRGGRRVPERAAAGHADDRSAGARNLRGECAAAVAVAAVSTWIWLTMLALCLSRAPAGC